MKAKVIKKGEFASYPYSFSMTKDMLIFDITIKNGKGIDQVGFPIMLKDIKRYKSEMKAHENKLS